MRALIDHAIGSGAEHLLFGGDLVDHGNVEDAEALRDHLQTRGFLTADRTSVVPGNHDVWPYGEGHVTRDFLRALPADLAGWLRGRRRHHARRDGFLSLFRETFEGVQRAGRGRLPCVKRLGPLNLGLLDTSSRTGWLRAAEGHFNPLDGVWLRETLSEREGPRVVLMHHPPIALEVSLEYLLSLVPRLARRIAERAAKGGLRPGLDFADLAAVKRFLEEGAFDAVLCGHIHLVGGPRDEGYTQRIAGVPVHVMGRSGGVHQPAGSEVFAYHLGAATRDTLTIETVFVEAAALT